MGDGCMMEGVAAEAASLAGHLGLDNLCWIYDNNHITIEGSTSLAFTDDVATRFRGWNWNVEHISDVNNLDLIDVTIRAAQREPARPTLVITDTHIGWGSPNRQDTREAHGAALGVEEVRLTKLVYGWPPDAQFLVPDEARQHMGKAVERGAQWEKDWQARYDAWAKQHPDLDKIWQHIQNGTLPDGWDKDIPTFPADAKGLATRKSDQQVLNAVAKNVPWLLGGSADLHPSTFTLIDGEADFERSSYGGRNFHFGIREHTMGSILNGMALTGLRPYGSTFLIFSDYMRPPIRLAALMDIPVIFIYTHDSIGVGEDGPTHQPIEQLMSLRAIPRLLTFRPADANEVAETWRIILPIRHQPVLMALTRQGVPTFDRTKYASAAGVAKGAYILAEAEGGQPELILMGTGSEVQLCVDAYEKLTAEGIKARVISMPCWELFEKQSAEYKLQLLPPQITARVAVEAGTTLGWKEYVGHDGVVIGRADFGASAPIKDVFKEFGFTVDNVVAKAKEVLQKVKK
jgi:transketolase